MALKFLLCLDIIMNPLFHTDFSISDSLKNFRKSVLIYETIIILFILIIDSFSLNYRITNQFVIIQIFHMHIYCTDLMIFISIIIIDTFCHITTRRIQSDFTFSISHLTTSTLLIHRSKNMEELTNTFCL